MRKRTVITEEIDGIEVELSFEPVSYIKPLTAKIGDTLVIAYCADDCAGYWDIDDLIGDNMGRMYSFHQHATKDHEPGLSALGRDRDGEPNLELVYDRHTEEATERYIKRVLERYTIQELKEDFLGPGCRYEYEQEEGVADIDYVEDALRTDAAYHRYDCVMFEVVMESVLEEMFDDPKYFPGDKDAQLLDCYQHGHQHWSLSGGGMQCRWDTARGAGVWVPDELMRQQLDEDEKNGKDRDAQARVYCKQFLNQYNAIINGEVYGVVVEWYDGDGESIDNDHCWGYVGSEYAEQSMKEQFDWWCRTFQKQQDKAAEVAA